MFCNLNLFVYLFRNFFFFRRGLSLTPGVVLRPLLRVGEYPAGLLDPFALGADVLKLMHPEVMCQLDHTVVGLAVDSQHMVIVIIPGARLLRREQAKE
jgi:hypothetical protein